MEEQTSQQSQQGRGQQDTENETENENENENGSESECCESGGCLCCQSKEKYGKKALMVVGLIGIGALLGRLLDRR